jgi:thiol-disulfide isomerase/thioredoxin
MTSARIFLMVLLLGATLGGGAYLWGQLSAAEDASRPPLTGEMRKFTPTDPPRPAPDIGFGDLMGKDHSLADWRGQVVLVNLWATWCQPCVEEMPALGRLQATLGGRDFTVLALSSDRGGGRVVEPFLEKMKLEGLPVFLDPKSAVVRAFGARGLPTSILIDREGREVGRLEGAAAWDSAAAAALIRHYIGGGRPKPGTDPIIKTSG